MGKEEFDVVADEFLNRVEALWLGSQDYVQQAREAFDGKRRADATPEQMAENVLGAVGQKIDATMSSFDKLMDSLRMPRRYRP